MTPQTADATDEREARQRRRASLPPDDGQGDQGCRPRSADRKISAKEESGTMNCEICGSDTTATGTGTATKEPAPGITAHPARR